MCNIVVQVTKSCLYRAFHWFMLLYAQMTEFQEDPLDSDFINTNMESDTQKNGNNRTQSS